MAPNCLRNQAIVASSCDGRNAARAVQVKDAGLALMLVKSRTDIE